MPLGRKQNGTVLRGLDLRGAGIWGFTVHQKIGGKNGGTVVGGNGIRGAGIGGFTVLILLFKLKLNYNTPVMVTFTEKRVITSNP